jgi:hypothetical protein
VNSKRFRAWCERGQALAEYMPTIAGAMALSAVIWMSASVGVKGAYCKVVDAFTDLPKECVDQDAPSDDGSDESGGGGNEDNPEPPVEPVCTITLSSAPGTDPKNWNTAWDQRDDVLTVAVSDITKSIPWSLKLRFPTNPSSSDTEIASGVFTENGTYNISVPYPPQGSWGPVSQDGYGTYESHATLHIGTPCGDIGWDRWYKAPWQADVAVDISGPVQSGGTYTFDTVVHNNGPYATQLENGQGVVVNVKVPSCTTVESIQVSQGTCETVETCSCGTHVICDFGVLNNGQDATVKVVVKKKTTSCSISGSATLTSPRPPDPNKSNNSDTAK